jgi:hypothetical protein
MSETINYGNEELFGGDDFVFTRAMDTETGETRFVGGGYKVNSFFLQSGIPAMTTLNTHEQTGGKQVSSPFENLAVPAGLFYINQRIPKNDMDVDITHGHYYKQHNTISDDIIDKLFGLVDADKKRQRKTRKHIGKTDKKKTRRHN